MKKFMYVALAAIMMVFFASCSKEGALVDTSWEYTESQSMGATTLTVTMTLNFVSKTEGNLVIASDIEMGGVNESKSDTQEFTYVFDGKKGTMTQDGESINFELTDKTHISMSQEGMTVVLTKK